MHYILLLYALFASVFTLAKTGLNYTQPLFLIGSRMLVAGVILLAYQKFKKGYIFRFDKQTWGRLLLLALFNIYLANAFEFWGLKHLTSAKTCFIYSLSPFLSALLCYWMFTERLSFKKWMGLSIGCIGFLPILVSQTTSEELTGQFLFFSWAELSVMLAAASSVYGWILLRQLINENQLSPLLANGISMLFGGAMALSHSLLVEEWNPWPVFNTIGYLECAIALVVISNLVCYNLYGALLKKYSATFISFAGFTTPLFTAAFGWIFLGETVQWPFYLSFVIVFCGLCLFNQDELTLKLEEVKIHV